MPHHTAETTYTSPIERTAGLIKQAHAHLVTPLTTGKAA